MSPGTSGPLDDAHLVSTPWEQLDRVLPPIVSLRLLDTGHPPTLRECVPVWLRWLLQTRSRAPLTVRYYAEDLRAFITYCDGFGVDDPRAITEAVIETHLAALAGQGSKPATISRRFYALRSFFKKLLRDQVVARDPAATSYGPRVPRPLPRYLTVPEWRRLLRRLAPDRSPVGQRDFALIATLVYCGLRVAEAATLRLDAVRLAAGWLRVRGKGSKEREVPIPDPLMPILRAYLTVTRPQLVATPDHPYVFTAREQGWRIEGRGHGGYFQPKRLGMPLQTRTLYRIVMSRCEAILGRRVHPHMLRHTYATTLRRAGGDLQLVKELLGHADLGTTMRYSHLGTETRRAEVNRLLDPRPPAGRAERRRRKDARLGPHVAVSDRVRAARRQARLTQDGLAAKSGVSRRTLERIERGAYLPLADTLQRIAEVTGASVDWLLMGRAPESDPAEGRPG